MIAHDWECQHCGAVFEDWTGMDVEINTCPKCGDDECKKIYNKAPTFELKYNPKTDICDWDGNTTRFYDEYKKMKKEGKKPRIPLLDGDG